MPIGLFDKKKLEKSQTPFLSRLKGYLNQFWKVYPLKWRVCHSIYFKEKWTFFALSWTFFWVICFRWICLSYSPWILFFTHIYLSWPIDFSVPQRRLLVEIMLKELTMVCLSSLVSVCDCLHLPSRLVRDIICHQTTVGRKKRGEESLEKTR